ncbi:hypothetical protein T492DRAFT_900610 [Pavlovales sp. CCMP2436]|nr:hypothetical protein T492DRAFT_900610 [Pavlovales sp. CCMP2436]
MPLPTGEPHADDDALSPDSQRRAAHSLSNHERAAAHGQAAHSQSNPQTGLSRHHTRLGAQPADDLNEPAALGVDSTFAMDHHARTPRLRPVRDQQRHGRRRAASYAAAGHAHGYDAPPPGESDDARARWVKALRQKLTSLEKRDGADANAKLRHGFAAAGHAHEYDAPPPGESANARARRVKALRLKLTSLAKRGGTRGGGQD